MNSTNIFLYALISSLVVFYPTDWLQAQPVITMQPADQTIVQGENTTYTVEATGIEPLSYQWREYANAVEFTDISYGTNATLVLTNPAPTLDRFAVLVSDADGTTRSRFARLTVLIPVTITQQPVDQTVEVGETTTLAVSAESETQPLSYQWRFNGTDILNATTNTLVIDDIQMTQAGDYEVVVSNAAGAVTSDIATVTVLPAVFERVLTGPGAGAGGNRPGAWADYDNDGWVDLFIKDSSGLNLLFNNNGDGSFTRISAGPVLFTSPSGSAVWGDYDNDGNVDLFMSFGGEETVQLYRNLGGGEFVPVAAGDLNSTNGSTRGCAWVDYDNDGHLDLFRAISGENDMLYQNEGDGAFSQVFDVVVVTNGPLTSYNPAWVDFDNDGSLDLSLADPWRGSTLFANHGGGGFSRLSFKDLGFALDDVTLAVAWADYDNDGDLDVFVANHGFAEPNGFKNRLFRNEGGVSFTMMHDTVVSLDKGQSSSAAWADYDNDGWLDLVVANGGSFGENRYTNENNFLYRSNGDGTFAKVTVGRIPNDGGFSFGCSWADINNDGFLDLFIANRVDQPDFLYRNAGNSNAWLMLKLVGEVSNRSAIGARVRVDATIDGRAITQLREITTQSSVSGQDDVRAHFGLGDAAQADIVRIEWPSGIVQQLTNVVARQILNVTETAPAEITFTVQPQSMTIEEGKTAKLFAKVSGPPPLTFQWQKDNQDIAGASHRILTFVNVEASDAGNYRLLASSDGLDPVWSDEVPLTVIPRVGPGPHEFTGITPAAGGKVEIGLAGEIPPGFHDIFGIEATTDFNSWTVIPPVVSATGFASFLEDPAQGEGRRFFRAVQQGYWTPYPAPSGPHAVGTERRYLTDPLRNERGTIVITLWYPAEIATSAPPALWYEGPAAEWLRDNWNPGFSVFSYIRAHAVSGLPSASSGAWPVVIHSHGHRLFRGEHTQLMTELASQGYLAIAVDHIDASISTLETGTLVTTRGGFDDVTLADRVRDVRFLMDQVALWDANDPLLRGKLDLAKIGAMGFSFGGETVLNVAREDTRCRATVALDAGFTSNTSLSSSATPALLFLGGIWDTLNDPARVAYNQMQGRAYFMKVQGTVHSSFSSFRSAAAPETPVGDIGNQRMYRLLRDCTLSFFNKYLHGEDNGFLDDPVSDYPEIDPYLHR